MTHYYVDGQRYYLVQNTAGKRAYVTKNKASGRVSGWRETGKDSRGHMEYIHFRDLKTAFAFFGEQGYT